MNKIFLIIAISLLTGFIRVCAMSQQHIHFKQLNVQDGLADNTVLSIHKDAKGFLWMGTNNGLSKYDGNHFTTYTLNQQRNLSVHEIAEDSKHGLYLRTNDWISYLDCQTEASGRMNIPIKDYEFQVTDFLLQDDSTFWACNNDMLGCFRILRDSLDHPTLAEPERLFPFDWEEGERCMKFTLREDRREICLVTSRSRVLTINPQDGTIIRQTRLVAHLSHDFGLSTILYRNGQIIIASLVHGIFILDRSLQNQHRIVNHTNLIPDQLSHNDVYSLIEISDSTLLAATWRGYTILTANTSAPGGWSTSVTVNDPTWQSLNFEVRMVSAYYDNNGYLWLGTHGGGVLVADWKWSFIRQYDFEEDNEIESIIPMDNNIYLSTYEQGLFYLKRTDLTKELQLHRVSQTQEKTILCSATDQEGNLWSGCKDGTLISLAPANGHIQHYQAANAAINALHIDSHQGIWLGTDKGLFRYAPGQNRREEIDLQQEADQVYSIAADSAGRLWLATGMGLACWDEQKREIRHFQAEHPMSTAQTVYVTRDGTVYVGYQNGLGVIPAGQDSITHVFTTADGLESQWINCLQEDRDGYLWIGTNSGFSCYDRHHRQFYNYYAANSCHTVRLIGNDLWWGGNKHMLFFPIPQALKAFQTDMSEPVVITGLEIKNKSMKPGSIINDEQVLKNAIEYTDCISLSYQNKDFALSFNGNPYQLTQNYAYRLLPYQTDWITCSSKEKISYANLPPQTYTFQIKRQNAPTQEQLTTLSIHIRPHWTQTGLFRGFLVLICLGGIYAYYLYDKKKRQRQQLITELEHGIAVYELQHQQEIKLKEEQISALQKVAHELRPIQALILYPLDDLLRTVKPTGEIYNKLVSIQNNILTLYKQMNRLLHIKETGKDMEEDGNEPEKKLQLSPGKQTEELHATNPAKILKGSKQYEFMQKVINAIEKNMQDVNLNVQMLSDELCMSQPTLYRKVKENFQQTVTELIRKMRMNKAASLLALQKYTIMEVSEMVGYNDYETFRKHFKKQFGVSASQYISNGPGFIQEATSLPHPS